MSGNKGTILLTISYGILSVCSCIIKSKNEFRIDLQMINMIFKRTAAIILSTALLLSSTSCGFIIVNVMSSEESENKPSESSKSDESSYEETGKSYTKYENPEDSRALSEKYLSELPVRDYDGAAFFITATNTDYISPENTESTVSRLAMIRNAEVEELLNITLITTIADSDTMLAEMKNAIASDSYYTDLLMPQIYTVGSFRIADTLMNMRTLPFFDLDKPYFNANSSDMTSGGYSTYGVAGDASISPSSFTAVYMNKSVLNAAGADTDEIYSLAENGKWTWDEYLTLVEAVKTLSESTGRHYYTTTAENTASRLPDLIFKASGNDFISAGIRRVPVVGYTVKNTEKTMDTLYKIYNDSNHIIDSSAGGINIFTKGESAFLIDYLYVMSWMTNSAADWGILPLPKEEESDDYRTLIANTEAVFAVPKNHTNGEFAAITLSYLNAASYGYIYDEYVDYSMLHVLRDNSSVNMLDLILDTPSFDFAFAFGNAYPTIAAATYQLIRDCAPKNNLEEYFTDRQKTANETMRKYFDLKY